MDEETEQQQSANFFKLISLLVDVGAEALRDVLLKEIPLNQLANELQRNYILLLDLKKKKVLTDPQFDLLQEQQPDPAKFDISLLVALLRNICLNIEAPNPDWKVRVPDANDHSMGAELLRIKTIRNTKLHKPSTLIPKAEYTPLWAELEGIILRIATKVSPGAIIKASKKIGQLESAEIDPSGEKEKKLLKTLQDWQTQIVDIINEKIKSVGNSLESLNLKTGNVHDVVDAVRIQGDTVNERLVSIQDQMSEIAEDVSSITQDVSSMSLQVQAAGGGHIQIGATDINEIKEQLKFLQEELASIKQHIQTFNTQTANTWHKQAQNPGPVHRSNVQNVSDLSNKEIDQIAKKIGFEWERLALILDYSQGQIDDLKDIYSNKPVSRNIRLIQTWSNVVSQCGESPRTLLAAAFSSIDNNEMAQSLVSVEEVERIKDKEASKETRRLIQEIDFEGRTQPQDLSSLQSIPGSSQSSMHIGGARSVNIYGGKVRTKDGEHIHIGQPSILYTRNPDICRAEGYDAMDTGAQMTAASARPGDSNLKKTLDNTLSEATVKKYHETMKSVGALVTASCYGTVFRVGTKYVMTAWHVVHDVIDPLKSGDVDWSRLQPPNAAVSFCFEFPNIQQNQPVFSIVNVICIDNTFDNIQDLDIVILELSNPEKLPPRLKLNQHEISFLRVPYVDIIGYGHPKSATKSLDPGCKVVLPQDHSIQEAHAWLQKNQNRLAQGLGSNVIPGKVDWGFRGHDRDEKIIFNCFLEKGSSGAPMLTTACPGDPLVVGVVTNGLPHCFWDLSSTAQLMFPDKYRFEMGSRMNHIYRHLNLSNPELAKELFQ